MDLSARHARGLGEREQRLDATRLAVSSPGGERPSPVPHSCRLQFLGVHPEPCDRGARGIMSSIAKVCRGGMWIALS
eukprot:412141-Pyramimonas_sp.AAC.1